MTTSIYLASAAVMGALVVGVVLLVAKGRKWRRYTVRDDHRTGLLEGVVSDSRAWRAGFILLVILAMGMTVFALGGGGAAVYLGVLGVGLAALLTFGVYALATTYGHPRSHAVGEAIVVLGALALVVVVGRLLLTAGA